MRKIREKRKKSVLSLLIGVGVFFALVFSSIFTMFPSESVAVTYQDADNTVNGFGGGSTENVEWDGGNTWLQMNALGLTNGMATYTSRIFDGASTLSWETLAWNPYAPYGKALPDNQGIETAYAAHNVDMTNNTLLFHMDENNGDVTNDANNTTANITEGTSLGYGYDGVFGNAFSFSDDNSDVYGLQSQNYASAGTKTLSVWFYTTSSPTVTANTYGGDRLMGTDLETHGGRFYGLYLATIGGQTKLWAYNWDGSEDKVGVSYDTGRWNHAVMVHTAGVLSLYLNGSLVGSTPSGNTTNMNTNMYVGGQNYVGLMDEAAVFNDGLTAEEVQSIYYRGALNVKFQMRTCELSDCSDGTFVGPSANPSLFYTEENAATATGTPQASITGLGYGRYAQYQVLFETSSSTVSPYLQRVTVTGNTPTGEEISWDGGGIDDDWCTAQNWSGDTIPTEFDYVTVDVTGTVETTGCANGDIVFRTLTIGENNSVTLEITPNLGAAGDITIGGSGVLTQLNSSTQTLSGTLLIENGGLLTHGDNGTSHAYSVNLSAETISIALGGMVTVDGLGFDQFSNNGQLGSGYGPGGGIRDTVIADYRGTGASHGGIGGFSSDIEKNATSYCTLNNPSTIGSGGTGYYEAGDGGGHVRLVASDTFTINGTISADGEAGQNSYGSGGSGGSLYLAAGTFLGIPEEVSISGGNGLSNAGGGGGGCAFLRYSVSSAFDITTDIYDGHGGSGYEHGGPGAFLHKKNGQDGTIYIKNNNTVGEAYEERDTAATYDMLYLSNAAIYDVTSTVHITLTTTSPIQGDGTGYVQVSGAIDHSGTFNRIDGATLRILDGGVLYNDSALTIDVNGGLDIRNGGIATTTFSSLTSSGTIHLYNGASIAITDLTIQSGETVLYGFTTTTPLSLDNLIVSGGTLTHAANESEQLHVLHIEANTITVEDAGSINVDGKGYAGVTNTGAGIGNGPGAGTKGAAANYGGSGGSHAGRGGESSYADDPVAEPYCETTNPSTIGSTGVGYYGAGNGGGLIRLIASTSIDIAGTISADGTVDTEGTTTYAPGGAGGGIFLSADSVLGTPASFTATGGSGTGVLYGTGGGGCIAVLYNTTSTIDALDVDIRGGQVGFEAGEDGTFYTLASNMSPSTTLSLPTQQSLSGVQFQSIVSDSDNNATSLQVEYSQDALTWASSSFANVIASTGTVSTVTGTISSIDTNVTSSITLTIHWNASFDLPNIDDTTVYIRVRAYDGTSYSSWVTSSAFAVDTAEPTAPGNVAIVSATTSSIAVTFPPSTSVDTNFREYRIYYDTNSGVSTNDTAFTSSSDPNLGSRTFNGVDTSAAITGLTPNTQYYLNLFAFDTWGNVTSSAIEVSTTTVANPPVVVSASASTTDSIILSWGTNENPVGTVYQIYNANSSTLVGTTTESRYTVTELNANTAYTFSVRSVNIDRTNSYSAFVSADPAYTLASSVSNIAVTNSTNTTTLQIALNWTDAGQNGMMIDRDNNCDGSYDVTLYNNASVNLSSPTTTSDNVSADTCYRFRIRTYNGDGVINNKNIATVEITTPPAQVTNVTVTEQTTTTIDWSWDAVVGSVGYYVYNNGTSALLDTVIGVTTYRQTGLAANTLYAIIVRAYNANGSGIASNSASGTTDGDVPSGLTILARTTDSITVSWTDNGESAYEVRDQNSILNTSGETTSTTWLYNGLTTNTAYTVEIRGKGSNDVWSSFGSSITRYSAQAAPTSVTTTVLGTTSMQVTVQGTFLNNGVGSSRIYIDNGAGTTQNLTNTTTWENVGLTPNTQYSYTSYATNGDDVQTASVSTNNYTFANIPGPATVSIGNDATSLEVVLDENDNPDTTEYLLYVTTTGHYVDEIDFDLGGDSNSFTAINQWNNPTVTGLSPNTCYQFVQIARNGNGIVTASSTASDSVCTRAMLPTDGTATANGTTQITVNWEANGNPSSTEYYVEDANDNTRNSGWTTSTNYLFTNLTAGESYTFRVKARNTDSVETNYLGNISVSTESIEEENDNAPVPASIPGKTFSAPTLGGTPSVFIPGIDNNKDLFTGTQNDRPYLLNQRYIVSSNVRQSTSTIIAGVPVAYTIRYANDKSIVVRFHHMPHAILLFAEQPKEVDMDGDGVVDTRCVYRGRTDGRYMIEMIDLFDERELSVKGITINDGAYETENPEVTVSVFASGAVDMAMSVYPDFRESTFIPYASATIWTLEQKNGTTQTIYVRFRAKNGATIDSADSIVYIGKNEKECHLEVGVPYQYVGEIGVYMLGEDKEYGCTKQFFSNEAVYFSYFESFDTIVRIPTSSLELQQIPLDEYSSIPYGPRHNLFTGDVVKLPHNPKVYLIARAHRHWVLSEASYQLFSTFFRAPIKSVTKELLDQYPERQPIQTIQDVERVVPYQFTKDLFPGDTSEDVRLLQMILIEQGYALFPSATGYYGDQTATAVSNYEAAYNMPITGIFSAETRRHINNR